MATKKEKEKQTLLKIISELKKNNKEDLAYELSQLITCGEIKPHVTKTKNFGILNIKV